MRILAIETSCDETAVAIMEADGSSQNASFEILGNALYSQASLHSPYGGVYPSLAKREHQNNLSPLLESALKEAGLLEKKENVSLNETGLDKIRDAPFKAKVMEFLQKTKKPAIDLIAVTEGPGLEPALWTGINFAEALGSAWETPVIGIDHMEGHLISGFLKQEAGNAFRMDNPRFPALALLISGGHTEFILSRKLFEYEHIGQTKDDAVGEAFDKVARLLGFPYPGGPEIAEAASRARERNDEHGIIFPRPMKNDDTCDFSFSGLKTAVLYKMRSMEQISEHDKENIAQAFEDAARDVIVSKTERAIETTGPKTFVVGGGVSANAEIRGALTALLEERFPEVALAFPEKNLTGDNAIMIGVAGYLRRSAGKTTKEALTADGSQKLS
jgi:N6-L-threonylcarbamoyladenine synthase